jgi:hypothetical protein
MAHYWVRSLRRWPWRQRTQREEMRWTSWGRPEAPIPVSLQQRKPEILEQWLDTKRAIQGGGLKGPVIKLFITNSHPLHISISCFAKRKTKTRVRGRPTCTSARLQVAMLHRAEQVSKFPRLAWVDSLDASVISKLPFKPIRPGTIMNISGRPTNTFQYCLHKNSTPMTESLCCKLRV